MHYFYSTKKSISAIISSQNTDGLEQKLHMPSSELTSLHSLALNKSLTDYCDQLTSAGSHRKVMEMLQHISVVLHTAHRIGRRECGTSFLEGVEPQWRNVIDRYEVLQGIYMTRETTKYPFPPPPPPPPMKVTTNYCGACSCLERGRQRQIA